jgi:two-component system, chemotaxis family, response regulator PixG
MDICHKNESMKLVEQLKTCMHRLYNGKLNIENSQGKVWSLYYQFGQIVWATEGTDPYHRWIRNIKQNVPTLDINQIEYNERFMLLDYWDYLLFVELYQDNLIRSEQMNKIVVNTIKEILFDLYQQVNFSTFTYQLKPEVFLDIIILSTSTRMLLKQIQEEWNNWILAGLFSISPYLSPLLIKPDYLRQDASILIYKNSLYGNDSLRDIATKVNQNVLTIARSLLPYIDEGIIELKELTDLPIPFNKSVHKRKVPLIACIDDNYQFCKFLERIITYHGMRFIAIQDPIQALPTLTENKPDLIFMNLMMPVINGYELCAQLRCCSLGTKTPIIILTESDDSSLQQSSMIHGATEFMNKSVRTEEILVTMNKYLETTMSVESIAV